MPAREDFVFVGQANGGAVPTGPIELILDANVVSIAENLGRKGYNPKNIDHRRMKNLAAWLANRPGSAVNSLMGLPEGAGFDGVISAPHMLVRRLVVSHIVFDQFLNGNSGEVFSPTPVVSKYAADSDSLDIDGLQDNVRELFGSVVLPNYLMLLAWELALKKEPGSDIESGVSRLRQSLDLMIKNVGFIPLMWPTLIYAELGDEELRRSVSNKVLKLNRGARSKSLRSGAWDIGLLQFISLMRASDTLSDDGAKVPVLVTNDEEFALFASMLPAFADSGLYELDERRIDPLRLTAFRTLLSQHHRHRKHEDIVPPEWETLIDIAITWERELGFSEEVILRRDFEELTLQPNHAHTADLIQVIGTSRSRQELFLACENVPDCMVTAGFLAVLLLHHIANDGDPIAEFRQVLEIRLPDAKENRTATLSVSVVAAMLINNPSKTAAVFGTLMALPNPELAIFGIVVICDELAEELAERQGRDKISLCAELSERLLAH